jgi:uncharacterized protein YcgI (DUF1989 family)
MFIRIVSVEESQVGDLNPWNAHYLSECFSASPWRTAAN